jgi:hypothetical protein
VRPGDWLLVRWVATAKPGDPFPEPWCHAHAPLKTMVGLLTELGVIEPPAAGTDVATIARECTAAAQRWLERNPQPQTAPQQVPRRMTWGPLRSALERTQDAAHATAAIQLADGAREFVLRAEQLQLTMMVEHHYEVQTRRREPGGGLEHRRSTVSTRAMWRLNTTPPQRDGEPGLDPALDQHYVTRDDEVRVSAARWETRDATRSLRYAPTHAVDGLTLERAQLLIDSMARTLASPQRPELIGELAGPSADGLAVWLGPQAAALPLQDWTARVLS